MAPSRNRGTSSRSPGCKVAVVTTGAQAGGEAAEVGALEQVGPPEGGELEDLGGGADPGIPLDLPGRPEPVRIPRQSEALYLLQSRPITSMYPVPDGLDEDPLQVLISLGGWTGSKYFSNAALTPESRAAHVASLGSAPPTPTI